jgi:protein-S-isoprenylcysteine O-methyltransferase Ste14
VGSSGWALAGSIVVIVCWSGFLIAWVAGYVVNVRSAPPVVKRRNWWTLWLPLAAAAVVARMLVPDRVWHGLRYPSSWLDTAGIILLLAGTAFTLWARWRLGTMWTGTVTVKKEHELRTDGPYAITRNPIYTGLLAMVLGTALVNGGGEWLLYLVIVFVALPVKIRAEEQLLTAEFPEAYPAYIAAVPRLFPRFGRGQRANAGK